MPKKRSEKRVTSVATKPVKNPAKKPAAKAAKAPARAPAKKIPTKSTTRAPGKSGRKPPRKPAAKPSRKPAKKSARPARKKPAAKVPRNAPVFDSAKPMANARWERFVWGIVQGKDATGAYTAAGYQSRGEVAHTAASRLFRNVQVAARIDWVKQSIANACQRDAVATRQELAEMYTDVIRTRAVSPLSPGSEVLVADVQILRAKVAAGKALAEMEGWNAPKKVESRVQWLDELMSDVDGTGMELPGEKLKG